MEAAILNGFGIRRLKNLNTCSNLKRSSIILLIVSAWCLKQTYPNDNTFGRFQTGDTVPLTLAPDTAGKLNQAKFMGCLYVKTNFT